MPELAALLDSNVVVAMVASSYERHAASAALLTLSAGLQYAVAAHSYSEAYSTLTRRNASARFRWSPQEAWATLASVARVTTLVGLTPVQTFEAISQYAADGGIGPRLYDRLIGEVALVYGIPRIITWNVSHIRSLFPALDVIDPQGVA